MIYKNLIKVFLCLVVLLANSSIFLAFDEDGEKRNSTKQYQKNIQLIDSSNSGNFNYKYKVDINSSKVDSRYIPIKFTVDIRAKVSENLENVLAVAYIDELVYNNVAVKSNSIFSNSKADKDNQGISIETETWLYDDTNIDRLVEHLKSGIKVKVNWNDKEEYVLIRDVEVNMI